MRSTTLWDLLSISHHRKLHNDLTLFNIHLSKQSMVYITEQQYKSLIDRQEGNKYAECFTEECIKQENIVVNKLDRYNKEN